MYNAIFRATGMVLIVALMTACQNQDNTSDYPPPAPIGQPIQQNASPSRDIFVAGDEMELIVDQDEELNGRYLVRPGGYVIMPRFGRVQIGGLSRLAAEAKMKALLEENQLIKATVLVERWPGKPAEGNDVIIGGNGQQDAIMVLMTGRISRPGLHRIPVYDGKNPGVYRAIVSAGGLADFSKASKVTIRRKDESGRLHLIPVRLDLIEKGEIPDVPIGNNDVIDIGEKIFGF